MRKTYDLDGSSVQSIPLTREIGQARYLELARASEPQVQYTNSQATPTLLVEPNTLLREGLRRILAETAYDPVALSSSFDEALAAWEPADATPFLLIMDGVRNHEEACAEVRRIKEQYASARVLMLVDQYDLKRIISAFQAGADAYLVKSVSCEVLVKTLDLVMLGEVVFPSAVLELLHEHVLQPSEAAEVQSGEKASDGQYQSKGLSVRETVILRCLMDGDSNKLIARKFDITEATVKVHVKAILRKIHAKNRTQAAIWAASHLPAEGQVSA
ncbi:LuxR C-terminal-related transcriptional regulator [Microvirga guangxiensis]|uniref:Two component transcriptional regulator, LuxR family n=1 Tax=Microvirga guangxiensis TaxID=549386 RepID=A0A1G5CL94_9HYPH|nr:response regulator transcription factor [Microvirga guangxiensis]SCY03213.1 two component transcriptional regulator, LuxR family [Microvirga guangxiensis]